MMLEPTGRGGGGPATEEAKTTTPSGREPECAIEPGLYINRELSWLDFDERVLEEARDPSVPLLQRLSFLGITASNLDEFFEVRVAGLQAQDYDKLEPQDILPDGMGPRAQLIEIGKRAHDFVDRKYQTWREDIRPKLEDHGIILVEPGELTTAQQAFLDEYFDAQVYPILTPLAIDPAHPFPHLFNKSLNIILRIENAGGPVGQLYAVVQVPAVLPRLVRLPDEGGDRRLFVLLEEVIGPRLDSLFGGYHVAAWAVFRVTRNSDLSIQEIKTDLLATIRDSLRQRKWGDAVRLEIGVRAEEAFVKLLQGALELEERDVYRVDGPISFSALSSLCKLEGFRDLKEPAYEPTLPGAFAKNGKLFASLRENDLLVHHPYESFGAVIQFIEAAADDPQVLAIKQTLYRTSDDNPIISALARAAENGKQVTALVELQARMDEENNIDKARALQRAGVHVVYGVVGLKTHCKAALVVRREIDGIWRYLHLSTGNYNPTTARIYTDLSYFTSRPDFGEDASALFNLLTGFSKGYEWQKMIVAPTHMINRVLSLIHREIEHAKAGRPARIIAKMNSLVEPCAIEALYKASQAGVRVDLIVRGICCLKPGIPGVSDNIRVISVVDKFLEHSRVFYFQNGDQPDVFLSSADWMPRNFRRRVELMFPIEAPQLKREVVEILELSLKDNVKARVLRPDGTYVRVPAAKPGEPAIRSQVEFQKLAHERAKAELIRPVEKATLSGRMGTGS